MHFRVHYLNLCYVNQEQEEEDDDDDDEGDFDPRVCMNPYIVRSFTCFNVNTEGSVYDSYDT